MLLIPDDENYLPKISSKTSSEETAGAGSVLQR